MRKDETSFCPIDRFWKKNAKGQREVLKGSLQEGMKVTGTISSIRSFGAFVRVGIVEGLIPISEIGWDRVEDIHEVLEVGQEVEVVAMKLDWEKDRLSFSLNRPCPTPGQTLTKDFPEGSRHHGTVVRLTEFGAFVTLVAGVDGLVHISKLGAGKRVNHPREVVAKGQIVEVKIDNIDKDNKRMSLSLVGVGTGGRSGKNRGRLQPSTQEQNPARWGLWQIF